MSPQFKFRYVNEIVGVFVLLVLGLLVVGIMLAGRAQGWFEPRNEVNIHLPEEGSFGLREGAEVQVLQTPVGTVKKIQVKDDGTMDAVLTIRGDFTRFVRSDSIAVLKKKFAVAGDAFVEITRGTGAALSDEGAYIECRTDTDVVEQVQGMVEDLRSGTSEVVAKVTRLIEEHTQLAEELRTPEGDLQQLLANLNRITGKLAEGEGTAGRLLNDPALADEMEKLMVSLNTAVGQVGGILKNLEATVARFPAMADLLDSKLEDVPDLILQTQLTLHELEQLIRGIERHWLIRKYIKEPDATGRIPAGATGDLE